MGALLWLLILPALLLAGLLSGGLYLNRLPWEDPPGFSARLTTYLDQHVAETAEGSPFPELRPRHYAELSPDALFAVVEQAVQSMPNWTLAARDAKMRRIEAVVSTSWLHFQDDMTIHVVAEAKGPGSVLFLRSQSRIGHGDLGANTRHVLDLVTAIDVVRRQGDAKSAPAPP